MEELRYEYSKHRLYDEQNPNGYVNANYAHECRRPYDERNAVCMALIEDGYDVRNYFNEHRGENPRD